MKYIKHIILTAMAVMVMTGAWAQTEIDPDPYTPTQQTDGSWQFTMPAAHKLLEVENYESRLDSVRTMWEVYINGASTAVHPTPYSDTDTMGYVIIPAGADVMITPTTAEATKVKDLEMFQMLPRRINLDTVQHHLVAQNGDTLTGTLDANNHPVKISIANGATVTLAGVTINGTNNQNYNWAGITCLGNVTITLKDGTTNTVKGFYNDYPGVFVYDGYTLTINGGGTLIASSNGHGAGIGGGWNISCGNIDIQGGIIEATGGEKAAGIGGGYIRNCGTITITDGVTRVTATKGTGAPNSIGIGYRDNENTCGTVTIGGTVYWQNNAYVGDGATYLTQSQIVYPAPNPLATPLTMEVLTEGTITVTIDNVSSFTGMKYSLDGGATKTAITTTTTIPSVGTLSVGTKVQFYGNGTITTSYSSPNGIFKGGTAQVKVYGNIMSLIDEENFATTTTLTGNSAFAKLFRNNDKLKDASGLLLPATTLTTGCYNLMFNGCANLETAPAKLPAMTLTTGCYMKMFSGCSSLTAGPMLPATTLVSNCYNTMFDGCTHLTQVYVKAAHVYDECYGMFTNCNAAGAVLHTTDDNKSSWNSWTGNNWTVLGDWND